MLHAGRHALARRLHDVVLHIGTFGDGVPGVARGHHPRPLLRDDIDRCAAVQLAETASEVGVCVDLEVAA